MPGRLYETTWGRLSAGLPFEPDRFDTVVATLVLCTVPDPAAALSDVARVLRPGGRFLYRSCAR